MANGLKVLRFALLLVIVLLLCALIAGAIGYRIWQDRQASRETRFAELAENVLSSNQQRLRRYALGLGGTRGAASAVGSSLITRHQFRQYISSRDLPQEFPGALGIGFIRRVAENDVATFEDRARADGYPDFHVRQLAPHGGDLFVIQYIEPEAINAKAIGLDIASESNRAQAARVSEAADAPTLTGPIQLVQKTGALEGGLLFMLPVFAEAAAPVSEELRRGKAVGWVYIPLTIRDVMADLDDLDTLYSVHILDVTDPEKPADSYQSGLRDQDAAQGLQSVLETPMYGRIWRYEIKALPAFFTSLNELSPIATAIEVFAGEVLLLALLLLFLKSRKQAREAHKDKEQLAAIVESSADAIIGKRLDGTVISWNRAAELMFGYSKEEAVGRTIAELIVPKHLLEEEMRILGGLAANQIIGHFETIRHRRDGLQLHVSVAVAPICSDKGTVVGASKTVRDITRQKQAEQDVRTLNATLEAQVTERTQELHRALEAANQASQSKAEFLANMSHEIRSPMNAVLGLAYLAEQQAGDANTRDLVRKIGQAGHTLLGVINDVLDFSKIEQGHLELERSPFRLTTVMNNLSTIMGSNVGDKPVEVIISPLPAGIDYLIGDALRLEQVLINLISNAIKFTEEGHVLVTCRVVMRKGTQVQLRFNVQDTGIGISPDKQPTIFSPFTQADSSTTRRFGGTGLGLAICKQLTSLMGGDIGVLSALGHGSEFWFTAAFEVSATPSVSQPHLGGLQVLIADDNDIALEALRRTSEQLGWQATVASGGSDAINRATTHAAQLDVLILDWQMPDKDGLTVARALRDSLIGQHAPIVVMVTAFSRERLLAEGGAEVADAVLAKPVTASSLYDAVAAAMHQHQRLSPEIAQTPRARRLEEQRLLVVDDSDINRELARRILVAEGAQVVCASDGLQAVQQVEMTEPPFDLILMDVQMPTMDGLEATRRIRLLPQGRKVPIVALTAGAFVTQREAALAAGMDSVVTKPFDVERTVALILQLTRHRQTVTPYPGVDIEQGLDIWSDEPTYKRYLQRFAQDYHDFVDPLEAQPPEVVGQAVHKLKGAAASLALGTLARCAEQVEEHLQHGEAFRAALQQLNLVLQQALRSIADYAGEAAGEPNLPASTQRTEALLRLLDQLAQALGNDTPNDIWPLLAELEQYLPAFELRTLRDCVEHFDFRQAERALSALRDSTCVRES